MLTSGRPQNPLSALRPSPERVTAAWSFPGARQKESKRRILGACFLALLGHAGISLLRPEFTVAAPTAGQPIELETLIPVDLPEPLDPPAPPEARAKPHQDQTPAPSPGRLVAAPNQVPSGEPLAKSDVPGQSADELAAPIATSDFDESDWSMLSGNGTALSGGSLGRPGRGEGARPTTTIVKAKDLSRQAIAPHLDPLVQRNYPTAAKMARVSGTVTVSAIVNEVGRPTDVRVVNVTPQGRGFGETCSRTVLQGPDWKPRLNRDGRPISAKVHYTCDFRAPEGGPQDVEGPTSGTGANRIWTKPAGG